MKFLSGRRWLTAGTSMMAACGVAAGVLISAGAAADDAKPKKRVGPPPKVYTEFPNQCARCHKADGRGGPAYGGFAADLRETELDMEGLVYIISEGVRQRGMPEFKSTLTKREIEGLATFILDKFKGKYFDADGNPITAEEAAKLDPRLKKDE